MTEQELAIMKILQESGSILKEDHFVLKRRSVDDGARIIEGSGDHSNGYVNKDAFFTLPGSMYSICKSIVEKVKFLDIDVVLGPTVGPIGIITLVTQMLYQYAKFKKIRCVYCEEVMGGDKKIFKRLFDKLIATGTKVLVLEDITTKGESPMSVIEAVKELGGLVNALVVVCDRGGFTAKHFNVKHYFPLLTLPKNTFTTWSLEECPLCDRIPVNVDLGHGRKFLRNREEIMKAIRK